jgi:hypothetical protein
MHCELELIPDRERFLRIRAAGEKERNSIRMHSARRSYWVALQWAQRYVALSLAPHRARTGQRSCWRRGGKEVKREAVLHLILAALAWHHAQFCVGGCFSSELEVDGHIVEIRSNDLKHVWYAKGWTAQMVDAVISTIGKNGITFTPR